MKQLGLIGYPLGHSFSKKYYQDKFEVEGINHIEYDLYPIPSIKEFPQLLENHQNLYGVNVTIPYKQDVIRYLDKLSPEAQEIGAVNCIQIQRNKDGKVFLKGFNTDAFGFERSIQPLLEPHHKSALILGNGGATKAIYYVLKNLGISCQIVSRTKTRGNLIYQELTPNIIKNHQLIINCSPVGTFPNIENCPDIPYDAITNKHLLFDLIYNPQETLFLKKGKEKGAKIKNGYQMLILQAEKNWEIWNQDENQN